MRNQIFASIDNDVVPELFDPIIENKRGSQRQTTMLQGQISIRRLQTKFAEKKDMLAAQIQRIVKHMPFDLRQMKAERHLYDAYYLRTVRNDIDIQQRRILKWLWMIENSNAWNIYLFIITLCYQILTFFEKPYPENQQTEDISILWAELYFLSFLVIDTIITIILTISNPVRKLNTKRLLKAFAIFLCSVDFLVHSVASNIVRFSRLLRPFLTIFYSKDLRRNIKGIVKASRDLVLLMLLYVVVISTFAFIGVNLIGTIENVDKQTQDYGDFFKLFSMLYMVATLDFYPDILVPAKLVSDFYVLFFVIYLLLFVFLFYPIPLAVVYEGFRRHRMQIAIDDIIKQKSAMMASFIALDTQEKGYLSEHQFKCFLKNFYRDQLNAEQLDQIYQEIDRDFNDKIQFDEFYQLLHVFHNSKVFTLPKAKPLEFWERFRAFCNSYGLHKLIEHEAFGFVMMIVTLINCILILTGMFIEDEEVLKIFDTLDTFFLVVYGLECIVKMIGIGLRKYFDDGWYVQNLLRNVFDLTLVLLQILFDYVLFNIVTGNLVQSIKANRILRLAKIQKVFRLFRAFRSIKIISFILRGFEILGAVQNLLYKIIICVPLILRLMLPVQIVFFCYATIGVYIYGGMIRTAENPYADNQCDLDSFHTNWGDCQYADFNQFHGAYLILLQTFIAASWSKLVFELTYDTQNMAGAMFFIGTFVFFSIFLLALIGGLVWEVFTVVSQSLRIEELKQIDSDIQYQEDVLLSSQGTLSDIKPNPQNQESAASQLKKKTLILNDDNPDVLQIKPRTSNRIKSLNAGQKFPTEGSLLFDKHQVPQEFSHRVSMQLYNRLASNAAPHHHRSFAYHKYNKPIGDLEDVMIQSQDSMDYQKLYSETFLDYNEFLKNKLHNQALNVSQVTKEYVIHLRNEIKKDEIFKQKSINIQNHDQLIQNAVLRDTSEQLIKQQEERYFKNAFGSKFERIKELKFESKFKTESKILYSLMGILKFPKANLKYFFQILYLIESYFTYQLLPENSFFKMLHQSGRKWYVITIEDSQIAFTKILRGPWEYADTLFQNTNFRFCENLKFMKEQRSPEYKAHLKEFRRSMGVMANQYSIDFAQIDTRSCCMLYHIKNDKYIPPDVFSLNKKSAKTIEEPIFTQVPPGGNCSQQQTTLNGSDLHKHVSRTILFLVSKISASEPRIVFQNQVLLAQFTQDLASVINNYASNFFQQLEDIFELKAQNHKQSHPVLNEQLRSGAVQF